MSDIAEVIRALNFLRTSNAAVRFESNKTVTVRVNNKRRRRKTMLEAVRATRFAIKGESR